MNLARRLAVRAAGLLADAVLLRHSPGVLLRPGVRAIIDRDLAHRDADRARRDGLRHLSVQPLPPRRGVRRRRAVQAGVQRPGAAGRRRRVPAAAVRPHAVQRTARSCRSASRSCRRRRSSASSGRSPATRCGSATSARRRCGNTLSRQTVDVDARYYLRLGDQRRAGAARARLQELGRVPRLHLLRRQLRDARLRLPRSSSGNKAFFANAELRFPLIEAVLTPHRRPRRRARRLLRQHRRRRLRRRADDRCGRATRSPITPLVGYEPDLHDADAASRSTARRATISGFRLVDGRASYGVGLETFALGFPIHFDWSWRTLFNKDWEDDVFAYQGIGEGTTAATGSASRSSRSGLATTSRALKRHERSN